MKTDTVITVGKFEALHLGHDLLIKSTADYARLHGLTSAVLSFAPHPAQVLYDCGYKPLYSKEEQAFLLKPYHIDRWIPYPFDKDFAQLPPLAFCSILKEQLNCKALLVGEGFRFGRNREGTSKTLCPLLEVVTIPYHHLEGEKISTSQIRELLAKGLIQEANKRLGRPFLIMGTVQKGRQLGRTMGFPTANIHPACDKFLPPDGVYATKITLGGLKKAAGSPLPGITNIGTNPTIKGAQSHKVETHIFDFDSDIYGEEVAVELYAFIRPEKTFSGLDELKRQIAADVKKAQNVLPGP